jgi:hypothetical protein
VQSCVDRPDPRVAQASLLDERIADSQGFLCVTKFAVLVRGMNEPHIELWRIGSVACLWLADWRRIRVVSAGETLSDQTLPSPSDALAAARELRTFFKFISTHPVPGHAERKRSSASPTAP